MHTQNKYYICKGSQEPQPWNPWLLDDVDDIVSPECIYFGKAIQAMERRLKMEGLTFYLTWDVYRLPSYGSNVVAIVLGDEWCRIPSYVHKVLAVFKCYGTRPTLGCNPLLKPTHFNLLCLAQFLKSYTLGLPGLLNYYFNWSRILRTSSSTSNANIYDIPLGYYKQLELPHKDIGQRAYDVFFSGSLVHESYPIWNFKRWIGTPKNISRRRMSLYLDKTMKENPSIKICFAPTQSFQLSERTSKNPYSEQMMNSKICLVPRGVAFETFRFFEALRYGCVIISEVLPSRWFYDEAPFIEIADWQELPALLQKLVRDEELIHKMSSETLNWWNSKCSEEAVGTYIADKLYSASTIDQQIVD